MSTRKIPLKFCATMTIHCAAIDPLDEVEKGDRAVSMIEHLMGWRDGRPPMFDFGIIHVQWRADRARRGLWIEFDDTVPVALVRGTDGFWRFATLSEKWIARRLRLLEDYLRGKP